MPSTSIVRQALILGGSAVLIAVVSFAIRRAIVARDEAYGRQQYNQQIAEQLEQIRLANQEQQQLQSRRVLLEQIRDSLERNPGDTSLLVSLGTLQIAVGDTLGALSTYRRYIDTLGSPNVVALTDYAFLLYATGDRMRGMQLTKRAIAQAPTYQIALYNMAVMEFDRGRTNDALLWMERCREADSTTAMGRLAQRAIEQIRQMQRDSL
jgi:cytochrome c-type biogenesis protein CcmH/NrfG